jgi:hypothetical protein
MGQDFQVGKVRKSRWLRLAKWDGVFTVNVWKGGPERSGGVDK